MKVDRLMLGLFVDLVNSVITAALGPGL
jgi:hypothetical protein